MYYEFGVFLVVFSAMQIMQIEEIVRFVRTIGVINAYIGVYETITRSSLFIRFVGIDSRVFIANSLGSSASRTRTVFMHPIICAVFCIFIWCILLYYPLENSRINFMSQIALLITILGTQSRSSWIAFVIVTLLYYAKRINIRSISIEIDLFFYVVLVCIIMMITYLIFRSYINETIVAFYNRFILAMDFNSAGSYNRLKMVSMGLSDYKKWNLFSGVFGKGYGYALSLLQHNAIRGWITAVDNTYLTVLLDYGIIGVLFLILYITEAVRLYIIGNRLKQMCGLGILSVFISGFFYELFSWATTDIILAFLLGILIVFEDDKSN